MTTDELAEHFAHERSGYNLVSYRPIALPVFRLRLRLLVLKGKNLPTVMEFILKAIRNGLTDPVEVASFLGLERVVVEDYLVRCQELGFVGIDAPAGTRIRQLTLTERGRAILASRFLQSAEERSIWLHVDGLTRTHIPGRMELHWPQDLPKGIFEVAAHPPRHPSPEELEGPVLRYLAATPQKSGRVPELVKILDIERSEWRLRDDAVALLYKADDREEYVVTVLVAGNPAADHEAAISMSDSRRVFAPLSRKPALSVFTQTLSPERVAKAVGAERPRELRRIITTEANEVADLVERVQGERERSRREVLQARMKAAEATLESARAELSGIDLYHVGVVDLPDFLFEAVCMAQQSLVVTSRSIRGREIQERVLPALQQALERGVEVFVGYGLEDKRSRTREEQDVQLIAHLRGLARRFKNLHFAKLAPPAVAVLICDDRFAVLSGFDWLAYRSVPSCGLQDERGLCVNMPQLVAAFRNALAQCFGLEAVTEENGA